MFDGFSAKTPPASLLRSFQGHARFRGLAGAGVQLQSQAVREAGEVIEDPHDVGDLQAGRVVETQVAQGLPIPLGHAGGLGAQLLRHLAQGPLPRRKPLQFAPALGLDGFYQGIIAGLDTQKLRVGLQSIEAILGRRGDGGHHLPLRAAQMARFEHDLGVERAKVPADFGVAQDEARHGRNEPEVVRVPGSGAKLGLRLGRAEQFDERLFGGR